MGEGVDEGVGKGVGKGEGEDDKEDGVVGDGTVRVGVVRTIGVGMVFTDGSFDVHQWNLL